MNLTSDVKPSRIYQCLARLHHIAHLEAELRQPKAAGASTRHISLWRGTPQLPPSRQSVSSASSSFCPGPHRVCQAEVSAVLVASRPWGRARLPLCNLSKRDSRRRSFLPFSVCTVAACAEHCTPPPCVFFLVLLRRRPPASFSTDCRPQNTEQQQQQQRRARLLGRSHCNGRLISANETVVRNARSLRPE
jgi:hypothetical protein